MSKKPYCVGNVTTNEVIARFECAEDACKKQVENPRDLLVFHESHMVSLGMKEKAGVA